MKEKGLTLKELENWRKRILETLLGFEKRADSSNSDIMKQYYLENAKTSKAHLHLINRLIEQAKGE